MKAIFEKVMELLQKGNDVALLTIVASSGSTPRGTGAKMVVWGEGSQQGTIGGGAIEYKATKQAVELLKEKKSSIVKYVLNNKDVANLGMICGGEAEVFIQIFDHDNPNDIASIENVNEFYGKRDNFTLLTEIIDSGWSMSIEKTDKKAKPKYVKMGDVGVFYEPLNVAGKVHIFGGGHVAQALVPVLDMVEFDCIVYDDREDFCSKELFPRAKAALMCNFDRISDAADISQDDYVIIMTRGHQHDFNVLAQALVKNCFYTGMIGSRRKIKETFEKLKALGFEDEDLNRIYSPIGLEIMSETPAEIAISIVAELIEVRASARK